MIVVFGGNGQLGQELTRAAALRGIFMHALSHAEADIADGAAVTSALAHWKPNLVVNAAAYTKVDLAETNVEDARRGNEIGPAIVAGACAAAGIPMVHISTDYVFDGAKEDAYLEADPVCPMNVYGRTKAAGEEAVRRALKNHVILRTAWVYSEFGQNFLKTIFGSREHAMNCASLPINMAVQLRRQKLPKLFCTLRHYCCETKACRGHIISPRMAGPPGMALPAVWSRLRRRSPAVIRL